MAVLSTWLYSLPLLLYGTEYAQWFHPQLVPYLYPFLHMAITGCDYLNLTAAAERLLAVDRDFKAVKDDHEGCTPRRTKFYIFAIQVMTVLFNIPGFWELQNVAFEDSGFEGGDTAVMVRGGANATVVTATPLRYHKVYKDMYKLTAELLIFKVTPWVAFLVIFLTLKAKIRYLCFVSF